MILFLYNLHTISKQTILEVKKHAYAEGWSSLALILY